MAKHTFTRHVTNIIDVATDYVVTKSGSPTLGIAVISPQTNYGRYYNLYGIYEVGHSFSQDLDKSYCQAMAFTD